MHLEAIQVKQELIQDLRAHPSQGVQRLGRRQRPEGPERGQDPVVWARDEPAGVEAAVSFKYLKSNVHILLDFNLSIHQYMLNEDLFITEFGSPYTS